MLDFMLCILGGQEYAMYLDQKAVACKVSASELQARLATNPGGRPEQRLRAIG